MRKEWEIKKLGDVCEFNNGQAHENNIDENGKYILINSKFISSDGTSYKRTNDALSPLYKGDIVMVMSDVPNGKALAKCFMVDENDTYTLNQRICAIRTKSFDLKFLLYQLNRNQYLLNFNNGENQTNLRKNDILNCPLLIPSLAEQKRIVEILDEAFAAIDKAKANVETNLQSAKELFESSKEQIFANLESNCDKVPLPFVCDEIFAGGDAPKENLSPIKTEKFNIPIIANAVENKGLYGYTNLTRVNHPSITIAARGSGTGHTEIRTEPFYPIVRLIVLIPKSKIINLNFLKYSIQNLTITRSGSAIPQLTVPMIKGYVIPLPKVEEQKIIVDKLDTLQGQTKNLECSYRQKLNGLEELKKSILQKAFNGELTAASKDVAALIAE